MRNDPISTLDTTRALTLDAATGLALTFFGNLYEENGAIRQVTDPEPGRVVGELSPGSPLYYYIPASSVAAILTGILALTLRKTDLPGVSRDLAVAAAAVGVATVAKIILISRINPLFRKPDADLPTLRRYGVIWLVGNGVSIVSVGTALVFLLRWRARVLPRG